MTHKRHVYYIHHPRDFSNEYIVYSGEPGNHEIPEEAERVTRDEALQAARWVHPDGGATNVTVALCGCEGCALAKYATEHPHGALAGRYRWWKNTPSYQRRGAPDPEPAWDS